MLSPGQITTKTYSQIHTWLSIKKIVFTAKNT